MLGLLAEGGVGCDGESWSGRGEKKGGKEGR